MTTEDKTIERKDNNVSVASQEGRYEPPRLTDYGDAVERTLGELGCQDEEGAGLINWC